jgi:NAD(P)-dependent dehydrogenase (short-subunit alcohol dehydrogenase family)
MASSPPAQGTQAALIIGASRGLGLGLAEEYLKRGWHVVGTVRGTAQTGLHALQAKSGGRLEIENVDINEPVQVDALKQRLHGRSFALLFVNAGVNTARETTIADVATDEFNRLMVTNALSPMRTIEVLDELVSPTGTIGAMSSGLASVADNEQGGLEVYRASKAALNTLMRSYAARHAGDRHPMVVIAPGWVRTDMGGAAATLGISDSVPGVVDAIASREGKPGLVYIDYQSKIVRW